MHRLLFIALGPLSVLANPFQLTSPQQISNVSTNVIPDLNTTIPRAHFECFPGGAGGLPTNKDDCEQALDDFVGGKSMTEDHIFAYTGRRTDTLPLQQSFETCRIDFLLMDLEDQCMITLAEIYGEMMGPDGVIKQCLTIHPRPGRVGGQVFLGRNSNLIARVKGQ